MRSDIIMILACAIVSTVLGFPFEGKGAVQEIYGVEKDGVLPVIHVYPEQGRYQGDVQVENKRLGSRGIYCLKLSDAGTCRIELLGGRCLIRENMEVNASNVAQTIEVPSPARSAIS